MTRQTPSLPAASLLSGGTHLTSAVRPPANRSRRSDWLVPAGLIVLSLVPVVAGATRLTQLASGAQITAENARFFAAPVPIIGHIVSISIFSILGALQFAPRLRRHRWHRLAGRLVLPSGLGVALSGIWLTLYFGRSAVESSVLAGIRLMVGGATAAFLILGFLAIRRRNYATHRRWMIRGYALPMGAGTQVFTVLPWVLLVGPVDAVSNTVLMAAGWLINLAIAEWIIRRPRGDAGKYRPR